MDASDIIGVADRVGIVAFAFSGVEVGVRRRLDVFGLLVMGVVTATGGGVMRDVILGRVPLLFVREDYLLLALLAAAISIPLVAVTRRSLRWPLAAADAAGLGAFAVAGAVAAIQAQLVFPAVLLLAILNATGGGVLRDVFVARVPLVLRAEVNASASALGALFVWAIEPWSLGAASLGGAAMTAFARILSVMLNLHLPAPGHLDDRHRENPPDPP